MSTKTASELAHIQQVVSEYYRDQTGVAAVYLFGSVLTDTFAARSDVDIGVLYRQTALPDWRQRLHDQMELNALIQRDVDLVWLNSASPILRYQVLKHGLLLVNRQPPSVHRFFVRTLNEYFDLKQTRRVIERELRHASFL